MSEYNRRTGVKHLRVRGLKAVRFCAVLKAVAVNVFRATAVKRAQMWHNAPASSINPAQNELVCVFKECCMTYWSKAVGFFMTSPTFCAFGFKNVA